MTPKTFKIAFEKTGENRRFPATSSYAELSKCLSSIWGDHPFVLSYKDEDGDEIAVNSEMEFAEAMNVAKDMGCKVLKFNAYTNADELRSHLNQEKPQPRIKNQPVHVGIVCDRSGMNPIVGPRYHVPGADYDLCEEEFAKLPETERVLFVKIETPVSRGGGCCRRGDRFGRMLPPMGRTLNPSCVSVDDLVLQASIAASIFDGIRTNNTEENSSPIFAQVLSSFVDAAGVAAVAAVNNKPQPCQGTNPLADLLGAISHDQSAGCKNSRGSAQCGSGGGKGPCQGETNSHNSHCNRVQDRCKKMQEHFMKMHKEQGLESDPLAALFSGLFDPSQNPCVQEFDSPPREAVHFGVVCDKSGMNPIVGIRYVIPGANYDLCAEEFEKLPESERVLFSKIIAPGQAPITCMKENDDEQGKSTLPTPPSAAAEVDSDDDMYSDESDSDDYEGAVKPIVSKHKKTAKSAMPMEPAMESPLVNIPKVVTESESEDAKFADQLVELASMGFVDRDTNLTLLKRYQGRVERVVNSILEL